MGVPASGFTISKPPSRWRCLIILGVIVAQATVGSLREPRPHRTHQAATGVPPQQCSKKAPAQPWDKLAPNGPRGEPCRRRMAALLPAREDRVEAGGSV